MERNDALDKAASWRNRPRKPRPDLAERNRANARHGMSRTRVHVIWQGMIQRCTDKNAKDFPNYGGRGISVCERWMIFENFLADMGEPPCGASIERQQNDKGYNPENCRWASSKEQARNKRSSRLIQFNGQTKPLAQWAEELGIERKALQERLKTWPIDKALLTPYQPRGAK